MNNLGLVIAVCFFLTSVSDVAQCKESHQAPKESGLIQVLTNLDDISRESGASKQSVNRGLSLVLDTNLPKIEEQCDKKLTLEFYKLAYAYQASLSNSENEIKMAAKIIANKKDSEFGSVSSECRRNLKHFATSVIRVITGRKIDDEATKRLERITSKKENAEPSSTFSIPDNWNKSVRNKNNESN